MWDRKNQNAIKNSMSLIKIELLASISDIMKSIAFCFIYFLFFVYACLSVQQVHVSYPGGQKRASYSLDRRCRCCEAHCGCWKLNLDSLEKPPMLFLTAEPILKPPPTVKYLCHHSFTFASF